MFSYINLSAVVYCLPKLNLPALPLPVSYIIPNAMLDPYCNIALYFSRPSQAGRPGRLIGIPFYS